MKRFVGKTTIFNSAIVVFALLTFWPGAVVLAQPQSKCDDWVARIVSIEGQVETLPSGETDWRTAKLEDTYCPEDRVRTLEKSRAAFILKNETTLRLDENTMVKFSSLKPESPTLLELLTGSAFFMSRYPRPLTIETPYVNAASGGTEFSIKVNPDDKSTTITVIEGQMNLTNEVGSAVVKAGQEAVTIAGHPPVVRIAVRPRDAIQWAVYYPPILSLRDLHLNAAEGLPETDWRSMVQRSISAHNEGDMAGAFSAIEGAPAEVDDARFYVYRASLFLSVGQVDEAKSDIDQALKLTPGNGFALALQSLIAVVGNERQSALKLAMEAEQAEPESVSVKIALSYAEQANFKLDEALASVQQAVKIDPEASLAWARLAELWMAHGYLDKAVESANKAAALNPKEVRIQTVLGFAYLTEIKVDKAKEAFMKAIALNSADPMPRLGLGLALIREGNLEDGRKQIEIAASLDPNNSLIRSYLGKAYYEEKRDPQAQIQFQMAKELDPMDPTPYLYDAIQKQTINRPVEALHDLEKSIELNNNRAVYRSQLLLDSDQASRSVNLGRIYDDLGFQQAGLAEAFKSVNTDPVNYSGHRFLSDSYASLPNSQIARQSDLLQSQLLQPLNNNPVQPSLGDRSAIVSSSGPVDPSFNEYSQLFNQNRVSLLASGLVGNNETWGEELVATGFYDRYSLSLGQFRYRTQGFRNNADIDQNIYNAFTQIALTTKLNIQGEVQVNHTNQGDLGQRFYPDLFSQTLDLDTRTESYRLGLHYNPLPMSDFILSGYYQKNKNSASDLTPYTFPPDMGYTSNGVQRARTAEGQYLFHTVHLNLTAGGGYFAGPQTNQITYLFFNPSGSFEAPKTETSLRHSNGYLYSLIRIPAHVALTLGGSYDKVTDQPLDRKQFNPKAGLMWNPIPSSTFRLAWFRTLRRDLVSNQTIEPTQVAGFQQFFQDFGENAVDAKQYGVGIDQRFPSNFLGGIELMRRNLRVPVQYFYSSGATNFQDQDETIKNGRAYLNWSPYTWVAASADYFLDRTDGTFTDGLFTKLTTQRVPLGMNFYHPSGAFLKVTATYIDQKGDFKTDPTGFTDTIESGASRFWIWDASLGYRLPKRYGIFTIGADNIFDRNFRFFDIEETFSVVGKLPQYQPARFVFAKLTLSY
jgi:tetratricopeptide (TPR) repeat protein